MLTKEEIKKIKIKAIIEDMKMKDVANMLNASAPMLNQVLKGKRNSTRIEDALREWIK